MSEINYGPLEQLMGTWKGDKGTDIAPEPNGQENNPYYETMTFKALGDVVNAESQTLSILLCTQITNRKGDDKLIHHQVGYWSWDAATGVVTHSFTIPRGVGIVACGKVLDNEDNAPHVTEIEVQAEELGLDGGIVQSPFMKHKARTNAFTQKMIVDGDVLTYNQNILLDIYGKTFDHTDTNTLTRQG